MGYWRPALRGAIMMALAACVAFVVAHNGPRWIADEDAWAMDETTGSPPRDKRAHGEQRGRIYDGVDGHRGRAGRAGAGAHRCRCASRWSADAGFARRRHPRHSARAGAQIREVR